MLYLYNIINYILFRTVFEKGEEQDSEVEEEAEEEQFDEDVDLYSNVLKKMLPGTYDFSIPNRIIWLENIRLINIYLINYIIFILT